MPAIRLDLDEDTLQVRIDRDEDVPELFWARLRGELGADGLATATRFTVPLSRLVSIREIIRSICVQYDIGVTASAELRARFEEVRQSEEAVGTLLSSARALKADEVHALLTGTRFRRPLKEFQVRDLGQLLALPHGANFSVPGAGKTVVTFGLYEAELARNQVQRLLVVAPLSAFEAWETEAADSFAQPLSVERLDVSATPKHSTEVLLVNYQKLINPQVRASLFRWMREAPTHLVLDEAHRMKRGRTGAWGSATLDLAWHATRRDVLTGTPAPQHPRDLEALFEFLWPSQTRRILPREVFVPAPSSAAVARMATAIRPLFVRTRKSELGLTEPRKTVLRLELKDLHRDIYSALVNQYSGLIPIRPSDRARMAEMRKVVMYLLEAATNPALLSQGSNRHDPPVFEHPRIPIPEDSDLGTLLRFYARHETPTKFTKLLEIVKTNAEQGRKTLVWSNFVNNLEMLKRDLALYQPALIHGGVPTSTQGSFGNVATREEELARFRNDPDCAVLLANPAAMGEGVSLHQVCHDAVYLERTFNAGQYLQSVDRIHRLGLAEGEETRITYLVTKGTIDEVVESRLHEKVDRLSRMLDDSDIVTMALPDEEDLEDVESGFGSPIEDERDVAALFQHLRGENAVP